MAPTLRFDSTGSLGRLGKSPAPRFRTRRRFPIIFGIGIAGGRGWNFLGLAGSPNAGPQLRRLGAGYGALNRPLTVLGGERRLFLLGYDYRARGVERDRLADGGRRGLRRMLRGGLARGPQGPGRLSVSCDQE